MNKKAKKLTLSRDTIRQLESYEMGQAVGEAKPQTAWTRCETCGSCAQTCTPGCVGSNHTCITICPCTP
jgi:hypothetical protein